MIFNDAGLTLIKDFEKCSLQSYQDPGFTWTIGWGSTGPDIGPGLSWTQEQADSRLSEDVEKVSKEVTALLTNDQLNGNQFSALVCFTYNEGCGHLKRSTLLNCINTYHMEDAANEFEKWDKINGITSDGLLRRRKAEKALFISRA